MPAPVDMIARRFGRLVVIERGPDHVSNGKPTRQWQCQCDCGKLLLTFGNGLRSGHVKSCGCLQKDVVTAANKTHGNSNAGAYRSWAAMLQRCTNPKNSGYQNYGGRGISVCKRWTKFENFFADMGDRPKGMSIDRKDVMGDYCKDNCKWSTKGEQESNRRDNVYVTVGERSQTYSQWARELGISPGALRARYLRNGDFNLQPRKSGISTRSIHDNNR